MQKNDVVLRDGQLYRVIDVVEGRGVFLANISKRGMPLYIPSEILGDFSIVNEEVGKQEISPERRQKAQERYCMIAPILPYVTDECVRSEMIRKIAEENNISKQTIRSYLCAFLASNDVAALAPKERNTKKQLTKDQKNMRWALNKFYYTKNKNSLPTAYTMMLKEKYCDKGGKLVAQYPTFNQFRYFYRKTRKLQTYYISRDGIKHYKRNHRPLLGDGVQDFAPAVGTAMLDATVCDIYLVDSEGEGKVVGRPILVTAIDAYSSFCYGFALLWEGGVYSIRQLVNNIVADKVDYCSRCGIGISAEEWSSNQLPGIMVTDMGSEYISQTFEQITELGIKLVNLPSYRPDLKGSVEKFFDVIQTEYKKCLKGYGVIEEDFNERGGHDYRKDACLSLNDFEKVIIRCVLYYNNSRIVENFPYTNEMIDAGIKCTASGVFGWGKNKLGVNLVSVSEERLWLTLLPRTEGTFGRTGLRVNKLRYGRDGYTERFLAGGAVMIAYDPDDVSRVWTVEKGVFTEFSLIEGLYAGKSIEQVEEMHKVKRKLMSSVSEENRQAKIDLLNHIQLIVENSTKPEKTTIKDITMARKIEKRNYHENSRRNEICKKDIV